MTPSPQAPPAVADNPDPVVLVGMSRPQIAEFLGQWGEPAYRAGQVARWIYARGVDDPDAMTDLPAALRTRLISSTRAPHLELLRRQVARDGTEKLLFGLDDGEAIETVVLPFDDRTSICLSTQAGCPIRCTFCATGRSGYARNLTESEIVGQLLAAQQLTGREVSHIVFMGMGEPLLNAKRVLKSIRILKNEVGIPMRHMTLSTVGLVPEIRELADEHESFTLAVSLHAPDDRLRQELIPVAHRYPIADILDACEYYRQQTGRRVTFEYVLLQGVNDSPEQAQALAALLQGRHSHVNLIPYNPGASDEYEAPEQHRIQRFLAILEEAGIPATQRMEKGQEIMAACGQLRKQSAASEHRSADTTTLINLDGAPEAAAVPAGGN